MTGCSSYRQIEIGEVADHGKVRVTLTDGERETLHDPYVEADSITGLVKVTTDAHAGRLGPQSNVDSEVSIPLDQVSELAVGSNTVVPVLALVGALGVFIVLAAVVNCAGDDNAC